MKRGQTQLKTPVLFLIFNRPTVTKQVFSAIRQMRPCRLYVAADGPRPGIQNESENCLKAREAAMAIDWDCDVKTLFRNENLGCGRGVSSAITWFFESEPEGIILEDDCYPSPDFFPFCTELLDKYRNDKRIMAITGTNLVSEHQRSNEYSYSFSNHNNIWGWASWRRAWDLYDYEMSDYKKIKDLGYLKNSFNSQHEYDYFLWVFERTFLYPSITWDYQWEFIRRINSGLTIQPQKNLISNLGFGHDATHTKNPSDKSSRLKLESLTFPLRHPEYVLVDAESDKIAFIEHYTNLSTRIKSAVKSLLPRALKDRLFDLSIERFAQSHKLPVNPPKAHSLSVRDKKLETYSSADV
jgi:hypothetical protein